MSTQKALFIAKREGPWKLGENTIPSPGPKDVLVKIVSAALNPVDWKIPTYGWYADLLVTQYPAVIGTDGAGVVVDVGSEVTTVAKGDNIFFQGWFDNERATFQQYRVVPAELTAKASKPDPDHIPAHISFYQAASIPVTLATVVTALWSHQPEAKSLDFPAPWEEGGLARFANKPAFIVGGASSVGQYAIQMAKLARFSPIITTASLHNEALLKSLGATHVLCRSLFPTQILAELKTITGGTPIEYVYDTISLEDTQQLAYDALAPGRSLVLILPDQIKAKTADDGKKAVFVMGTVRVPENRQVGLELYSRVAGWLETGVLVPNMVEVLPNGLAGIPEGLERLKENKVSGVKLIARPQETP